MGTDFLAPYIFLCDVDRGLFLNPRTNTIGLPVTEHPRVRPGSVVTFKFVCMRDGQPLSVPEGSALIASLYACASVADTVPFYNAPAFRVVDEPGTVLATFDLTPPEFTSLTPGHIWFALFIEDRCVLADRGHLEPGIWSYPLPPTLYQETAVAVSIADTIVLRPTPTLFLLEDFTAAEESRTISFSQEALVADTFYDRNRLLIHTDGPADLQFVGVRTQPPSILSEGWWMFDVRRFADNTVSVTADMGSAMAGEGGVDGGYFTPFIDAEGVLSWAPSKEGMGDTPASVNIKGSPGIPGTDGITPHIGVNGNWFIGETDTGIPAQGPAGTDGVDGSNGITPHIDETTGNWFIGETDTGIPATGPAGNDGEDGAAGISITWLGTLAAPPDSPQQNQAYYNSTDKKAYIYNIEDEVGTWEMIAQDGVDTFPVVYSNEDPSVVGAGGILPGTTFTNITFPQFMNMLLYPELFPTGLVAPSFTFTPDQTMGFREIGEVIPAIVFTTVFDRGAITPQYQSESPYRSGLPNQYIYTGTGLTTTTKTDLSDVQTVTDYTVIAGLQGWTAAVAHDEGVQPKSSDGTNYGSPYPAGTLSAIERNIVGVYPFFATTANTFSFTKQPVAAMDSAYVETDMAVETDAYKQAIDFPVGWSTIVGIQAYNTIFEQWEWLCGSAAESLATFTQSSVSRTVNGNSVNYTRYTHNGVRIGSRQLRWHTTLG